jgi:hypothetical protein
MHTSWGPCCDDAASSVVNVLLDAPESARLWWPCAPARDQIGRQGSSLKHVAQRPRGQDSMSRAAVVDALSSANNNLALMSALPARSTARRSPGVFDISSDLLALDDALVCARRVDMVLPPIEIVPSLTPSSTHPAAHYLVRVLRLCFAATLAAFGRRWRLEHSCLRSAHAIRRDPACFIARAFRHSSSPAPTALVFS